MFFNLKGNLIIDILEKNITNAQLASSITDSNIIDLKASERHNNYVWTSGNSQVNRQLDLKSRNDYTFQIDNRDNNNSYQLIIQDENGKQLAKSTTISNGGTDDIHFKFTNNGKYQYHCKYHPTTMHGGIVV